MSEFTIRFTLSGKEITCPPGFTVLEAAEQAGIKIPFTCREGLCATCKSVLAAGEIDMHHKGGIRPKEIAAGKFLPCCSKPLSNLVIER